MQRDLPQPLCPAISSAGGGTVDRDTVAAEDGDRVDERDRAEPEGREEEDAKGELEDKAGVK